jgi:sigma-B regulation protein RsbU (phosphoserine phosphatase)
MLRHSVRTHLNHIAGYADILRQEASDSGDADLSVIFDGIRAAALELRELSLAYFHDPLPGEPPKEGLAELEKGIYGVLYDIIAFVQTVKRKLKGESALRFLPDTEKILDAANSIVELFEARLSTHFPETSGQFPPDMPARLRAGRLAPAPRAGRIIMVDDNQFNREILCRHLERQGHFVRQAADGRTALELLRKEGFDLLIMDVMMPGMNGYQLLEAVKADPALRGIYVIVISSLDDTQSIARCIQLGAEDYLPREFEPVILKARIESCLEKRVLKAKEELYIAAVHDAERGLSESLAEGADYVRGLLPEPLHGGGITSDWIFIPSRSLGGDVFGYHRLSDGRLALYLLDVSGHGIGAALYSVTLMNLLKTQSLKDADFGDPASVLARLNAAFQMEAQNNLYFTAWYGVWDEDRRRLRYASAGSPPAVLTLPGGGVERLTTPCIAIGIDADAEYLRAEIELPEGSSLYLFSDGAYEVMTKEGSMLGLDAFVGILAGAWGRRRRPLLPGLVDTIRGLCAREGFDDDVSLVEFRFEPKN